MGEVALILSPHLDDAVLSCTAYMQRLVREGWRVRTVSVFTEADAENAARYRARRAEDRSAAREIGAAVTHLGLLDAPFRSARYRDFCGIAFGRAREYPATRRLVAEKIAQAMGRFRAARIVAPLAVGNHVDHRLVRDAALLAAPAEKLLFYEDRPYAFVREQVEHVLGRSLGRQPRRFWQRYFATAYVRRYRGGTSATAIMAGWAAAAGFPRGFELRRECEVECRGDDLARTLAALRAYGSQMPDLFAGEAEREALYGGAPERIYRVIGRRSSRKVAAA